MNFAEARSLIIQHLNPRYGAGEASSIARIVLEDAFNVRSESAERAMTEEEQSRFQTILARLQAGEPVQYILGQADFFGLKFKVSPTVLIPRQETEELVAWVLDHLKNNDLGNPALLDIGLGSGCIAVALKKKHPRLRLFGLEKSPAALAVAVENAQRILGEPVQFEFAKGDILNPANLPEFPSLDVVVSNPPYIPFAEKALMPEHVLAHEPAEALFVTDADSLQFYRAIADFSLKNLKPGGALFFECNEFNAREVAALLAKKGFEQVELRKDISGVERMTRGIFAPD